MDYKKQESQMRELCTSLLTEAKVDVVIGFTSDQLDGRAIPYFAREARDVEALKWDDSCSPNLAKYVIEKKEKLALVAKPCDARAIAMYQIEEQVEKTIIFGIKPCDLEGLNILKAILTKGRFRDAWFVRRVENTIFIGMNCISEKPGCFCAERGLDKKYSDACDIFLTDTGDNYMLQIISNAGRSLFDGLNLDYFRSDNFEFVSSSCTESMTDTSSSLDDKLEAESSHRENLLEIDAEESIVFNKVDWDRIAERCMGCGICTYLCPTCHCFAFKDVKEKDLSVRYRVWDSCMYPKFTLQASGHNPRATKKERFRQRVMHKYVYIKRNQGYTACTGCGRCIRSCPVGMNIKFVVLEIMEELDE